MTINTYIMPIFKKTVSSPVDFDSNRFAQAAVALQLAPVSNDSEIEPHDHRKGQLIMSLHGAVSCKVPNALWLVPPQHALWIPGGTTHSCHVTQNARTCFLFVEPDASEMPRNCCTVAITPLVRELILYLSEQEPSYAAESKTARLVAVLLEQLSDAAVKELYLPISDDPRIRYIADTLFADPSNRTTLRQWAEQLATSERSLARLVKSDTGLSFGRWRQQLHLMIALNKLAEGQSVQSVAGTLGYDSVNAFITMFKKSLGKSPTQYFSSLR
ncbi:AraC family transcriptional regulator [Psychrobacter aestuarii]|uniref:Helix-turn-helix transcriptional regulator n=1 Tax=Psychrobacter aestuarii TaxID=556327 RepID=A0ABN0W4F9_9GAMM|nr:helix-turn-helix transcriptional regulator [Psychrobacter aestuarii]